MLCDQIKKYRLQRGLTQEQLGEKLHVVRQTVSKWESGASVPDGDLLPQLAAVLEVSVSQLLEIEDTQLSEVQARLDALQAQQKRSELANRKRGLMLFFAFLGLILAPAMPNTAWAVAAVLLCLLASVAVLGCNLELMTHVERQSAGGRAMVKTTVVSVLMVIALAVLAFLEQYGIVVLSVQAEKILATAILCGFMVFFGAIATKIPYNRYVGLRLPWTVCDEETWYLAHRILALISLPMLVLFLAGTIAIENYEAVAGISMLCWIGIPGALSYRFFRKKTRA